MTYRQCDSRTASKPGDKVGDLHGGGGAREPTGDGGPCLGRLISQSGQTALLGAPQHRAAAVGVHGAVCHREPEIRDTAQVRSAETREKKGRYWEKNEL